MPAIEIDTATIAAAQAGDHAAWDTIITRYTSPLRAYCYDLLRNRDEAEEVTQDTFVEAFTGIGDTGPGLRLNAWLYRIAHNACLDLRKGALTRHSVPLDPQADWLQALASPEPPAEQTLLAHERAQALRAAFNDLPVIQRESLYWYWYHDEGCVAIGTRLGITRLAVKSRLLQGRRALRSMLHAQALGRAA